MTDKQTNRQTGDPSVDKPWLKYYTKQPEDIEYSKKTLYQFVWDNNKKNLDDYVFRYFNKLITYRDFFRNIKNVVKALSKLGVKAGDNVTIMSIHTPETIYVVYGLNYLGAVANNIYPNVSENELQHIIANTESKALFVLDVILDKRPEIVKKITVPIIVLAVDESMQLPKKIGYRLSGFSWKTLAHGVLKYKKFLRRGYGCECSRQSMNPSSPAVIVYTSGTTGEPKGVILSNYCINALAIQDYSGLMHFERGKACLIIAPPFVGYGITQIHIMAGAGIVSILQVDIQPDKVIKSLFRNNPYAFLTGPAFVPPFLEHSDGNLKNLKYFISGGGFLTEQQINEVNSKLKKCGSSARLSNGYGMTEAASLLCTSANEISKMGSVGIPLLDTNVRIVNCDTNENMCFGEMGELFFSAPNIMDGYLKNEQATNEVIVTDATGVKWLKTGDLGTVDDDGFVFVKGRLKRMYDVRGKDGIISKMYPQGIEDVVKSVEGVKECGVIVREDTERMHVTIAFVSLKNNSVLDSSVAFEMKEIIHSYAEVNLPELWIPQTIHIVEKMPVTPSGKIDYTSLEKMFDAMG